MGINVSIAEYIGSVLKSVEFHCERSSCGQLTIERDFLLRSTTMEGIGTTKNCERLIAVTCWISCQPLRAICSGRLQFDVSGWSLKKLKKNMRRLRNCSVLFTLYVAVFCVWLRKKDAISQRTGGSYLLISLQWESLR